MLSLLDRAAIRAAARDPAHDPYLRAVLKLRFEQLGVAGAHFHVVQRGDTLADAEAAAGFPLVLDEAPCWEWVESHPGGWTEIVLILSDDAPAQVLLVPDDADPSVLAPLASHANG